MTHLLLRKVARLTAVPVSTQRVEHRTRRRRQARHRRRRWCCEYGPSRELSRKVRRGIRRQERQPSWTDLCRHPMKPPRLLATYRIPASGSWISAMSLPKKPYQSSFSHRESGFDSNWPVKLSVRRSKLPYATTRSRWSGSVAWLASLACASRIAWTSISLTDSGSGARWVRDTEVRPLRSLQQTATP